MNLLLLALLPLAALEAISGFCDFEYEERARDTIKIDPFLIGLAQQPPKWEAVEPTTD